MGERIAIFTGTFDPPHYGHRLIPEKILSDQLADIVYVVPDENTPFKMNKLPLEHRVNMVKLTFSQNQNILTFTPEMQKELKTGEIWNVYEVLKRKYPQSEILLTLGEDTFEKYRLFKHNFKETNFSLIVVRRGPGHIPNEYEGQKILKLDTGVYDLSSTKIREQLSRGLKPEEIDKKVFNYIQKHRLYNSKSCISKGLESLLRITP